MPIPNIPDNFYKLLILMSIIFFGYQFYNDNVFNTNFNNKRNSILSALDSLELQSDRLKNKKEKLFYIAGIISERNNIENPLSENKTSIILNRKIMDKSNEKLYDTISNLYFNYKEALQEQSIKQKYILKKANELKELKKEKAKNDDSFIFFNIVFLILFLIGYSGFRKLQDLQDEILKRQVYVNPKGYEFCQSCGKMFNSMRENGKEVDGSKNPAFCLPCYDNGKFKEPDLTKDEFMKRIKDDLKLFNIKGKYLLKKRAKNLERWKQNEYFKI